MGSYPEPPVGPTGPHPEPHPIPGGPLSSTAPSTGPHPEPPIDPDPIGPYPEPPVDPTGPYPEPPVDPVGPYPEPPVGPTGPHPQPHPIPGGPLSSTAPSTGPHPEPHPIPGGHAFESEVGEEVCNRHHDCQAFGFGCNKGICEAWEKDSWGHIEEIKKQLKNGTPAVGQGPNKSLGHGSKKAAPSTGHYPGPHPIPGGPAFESEVGEEFCKYEGDCQTVGFGCSEKAICEVRPKHEWVHLEESKKKERERNSAVRQGSNKSLVHGSKKAAVGHGSKKAAVGQYGSNKSLGQHGSNTESEKRIEEEKRRSLESFHSLFESEDSKIPQEVVDQMDIKHFGKKLGPLKSNKSLGSNGSKKSLGHGAEFEKICNQIKLVAEKKNDGKAEKLFPYCFGSIGKKKKH